ncbi:MAG: TraR/DksA family transcriptional regulator [Planctomycetota bacterium]
MSTTQTGAYEKQLRKLRRRLLDEVDRLDDEVLEHARSACDLSDVASHLADRASDDFDTTIKIENSERDLLVQVEAALIRIDEGAYGFCQNCGVEIPHARLDALPYAEHCVPCEERRERNR